MPQCFNKYLLFIVNRLIALTAIAKVHGNAGKLGINKVAEMPSKNSTATIGNEINGVGFKLCKNLKLT